MDNGLTRIERDVVIVNKQGLHARPVMKFVDLASRFQSAVTVHKGTLKVDGRSPMEMMLLEANAGTTLRLVVEGSDADAAASALAQLIADKFQEE